jgi:rod shape-determining protein MreC
VAIRHRPRSTRLLVVTLVSISLAIITLDYRGGTTGPLASLGRTAKAAMAPLQEAVTSVTQPVENFFIGLANLPSLAEENRRLEEELAEARTIAASSQVAASELEELEGLLGLQELHPNGITAVVTANGVSNFDWTMTINRGSNDGIERDMPVIAGSAEAPRLVGRVIDVTPISAEVQLILDRDHAVLAEVAGTDAAGLVWGRGDQDLVMEIDPDVEPDGDEGVFTQGYEVDGQPGVYPSGLLIGQISRISPEANALSTPVEIRPAVDFSRLSVVLVLQARQADPEDASVSAP